MVTTTMTTTTGGILGGNWWPTAPPIQHTTPTFVWPTPDYMSAGPAGQTVECGSRFHTVMVGRRLKLILRDHTKADINRQLVLGALGGDPCPCVRMLMKWRLAIAEEALDFVWHESFRPFLAEARRRRMERRMRKLGAAFTYGEQLKAASLTNYGNSLTTVAADFSNYAKAVGSTLDKLASSFYIDK